MTVPDFATEKGWPRPVIGGYPVPWASIPDNLGSMFPDRRQENIDKRSCQVCGLEHDRDGLIYFVTNGIATARAKPGSAHDYLLSPQDDAIMHERCMRLAVGRCPRLRRMSEDGDLFVFEARWTGVIQDLPMALGPRPALAVRGGAVTRMVIGGKLTRERLATLLDAGVRPA